MMNPTPTAVEKDTKWWTNKKYRTYAGFILTGLFSSIVFVQNWFLKDQVLTMEKTRAAETILISQQMEQVNHRLNVKEAYRNKGLIDGAKRREEAYNHAQNRLNQVLEWCNQHRCGLPPELAAEEVVFNFEPIESILIKEQKEE